MSRITIEEALKDLNQLVLAGKPIEAFDKYYHDDVEMQENELPPTISKAANRNRELEFYGNITDLKRIAAEGLGIGDDISFVKWHYHYHHKEWGEKNYTQISVQHWKDGKIIREQFFYNS